MDRKVADLTSLKGKIMMKLFVGAVLLAFLLGTQAWALAVYRDESAPKPSPTFPEEKPEEGEGFLHPRHQPG